MDLKNRKIIIISIIVGLIIVMGILLALLISPVTNMLLNGTGEDFRNAGSCTSKNRPQAEIVTSTPEHIADSIVVIDPVLTPHPSENSTQINTEPQITNLQNTEQPPSLTTSTPEPYEALYSMADTSMMKDIVNILLIGVDFSEERLTWNGKKEWHSDVMMVLSVNFEDNRADLISLPRDTYAKIPGVNGIYKLNASLNCGGGLYNNDGSVNRAGLEKVCEAAEWMLGGIPVDYYYAVTMTSLKQIVDAFGGLDYNLEFSYNIQGRSYVKGLQHMDGQAVLDYCRVRKASNGIPASEQGDANRVNRQKRILVAFFEQMQKNNLIVKIPEILDAFKGELFTNCTPSQTAALAAFAYNLNRDTIGLYSMSGSTVSLFQWNFLFTDQANRVDVIKKVYNVKVDQYEEYTLKYGRYRWASMLYDKYMDICTPLKKYVKNLIDEDDLLPEFTSSPVPTETPSPTNTPSPSATNNLEVSSSPTQSPTHSPVITPQSTPVITPQSTPVITPDQTPVVTPNETPTEKPTDPPQDTPSPTPTEKPTETPTSAPTDPPQTQTISITVNLTWDDGNDADGLRPNEVPVKLIANGSETVARAAIKEDQSHPGKWQTVFKNLPESQDGSDIVYTVEINKAEQSYKDLNGAYSFTIRGSASSGFTIICKHDVSAGSSENTSNDLLIEFNPYVQINLRIFNEETRHYSKEQRELYERFLVEYDDVRSAKSYADKEAQKALKGKSNSLNAASISYINHLAELQKLAIQLAKEFNYTKVSGISKEFLPTSTGWGSSPWAVNYGTNIHFNEVIVDFN